MKDKNTKITTNGRYLRLLCSVHDTEGSGRHHMPPSKLSCGTSFMLFSITQAHFNSDLAESVPMQCYASAPGLYAVGSTDFDVRLFDVTPNKPVVPRLRECLDGHIGIATCNVPKKAITKGY